MQHLKKLRSQLGMTLAEAVVGMGLLSSVTIIGSMVTIMVFDNMKKAEFEQERKELQQDLSAATRGPRQLRKALEGVPGMLSCVKVDTSSGGTGTFQQAMCSSQANFVGFPAQHGGRALTNENGIGCFDTRGAPCAVPADSICPASCPVRLTTQYKVTCVGAGTRTSCPSNQASIIVRYSIEPEASTASPKDQFRPISATALVPPSSLWGDPDQLTAGATAVELTSAISKIEKRCPNGHIMQGLDSNGEPNCSLNLAAPTLQCGPGTLFAGYKVVNGALSPECKDAACEAGWFFNGFDPSTGNKVCKRLTGGTCDPGTAAAPGLHLVGLNIQTGAAICNRKACPPGTLLGEINSEGNALCYRMDWFPKCGEAGFTCSTPPTSNPPPLPLPFYGLSSTPPVSIGYRGPVFFTAWSSGHPTEGYRMSFLNRSGTGGPNTSFAVDLTEGLLPAAQSQVCQIEGALSNTTLHRCTHRWKRITRAVGNCAANQTFSPPNNCISNATNAVVGPSELSIDEADPVSAPTSFDVTTGTVQCPTGTPVPNGAMAVPTNLPANSRYQSVYSATVLVSCNYRYVATPPVAP